MFNLKKIILLITIFLPLNASEYRNKNIISSDLDEYMHAYLPNCNNTACIISNSGGGIRGLNTVTFLDMLSKNTNKKISEMFHMGSGTSTGAIITAGLMLQNDQGNNWYNPSDIADIYLGQGANLFKRSWINKLSFGLLGSKYLGKPRCNLFNYYFGTKLLSDFSKDIIIPYMDLTNHQMSFFKSYKAKIHPERDYYIKDVLGATTAAPTYFPIFKLRSIAEINSNAPTYINTVDGGVGANDPSLCALVEAAKLYPNADSYFLLSVGTGQYNTIGAKPRHLLQWAGYVTEMFMDNASDMTDYLLKFSGYLYNKPVIFCNIQLNLPREHSKMDDISHKNLRYQIEAAQNNEINNKKIELIKKFLSNPIAPREKLIRADEKPNNVINEVKNDESQKPSDKSTIDTKSLNLSSNFFEIQPNI